MKRLIDMLSSALGLALLFPVLAITSLAIYFFSKGDIFFTQKRVGIEGKEFNLYKFRTMTPMIDAKNGSFDAGSQARVTPIGKFLRRTKLDELPQLFNVLIGDMSLVGPRPEVRKWVDEYPVQWAKVHTVRPGITDPASIIYRNEEELLSAAKDPEKAYRDTILPHKLSLYEDYVDNNSVINDFKIVFKTFLALLN